MGEKPEVVRAWHDDRPRLPEYTSPGPMILPDGPSPSPSPSDLANLAKAEARRLIEGGWYQTSRAHRRLARFPDKYKEYAQPGTYALIDYATDYGPEDEREAWARRLGEESAGDHFLSTYAPPECRMMVSEIVFAHYRALGGGRYRSTAPWAPGGPRG